MKYNIYGPHKKPKQLLVGEKIKYCALNYIRYELRFHTCITLLIFLMCTFYLSAIIILNNNFYLTSFNYKEIKLPF